MRTILAGGYTDRQIYTQTDKPMAISEILQICLKVASNNRAATSIKIPTAFTPDEDVEMADKLTNYFRDNNGSRLL